MTQLILDTGGVHLALPESRRGGYSCVLRPLSVDVEMASGRLTREHRGSVWVVSYQYGFLTDSQRDDFLAACETGWRQAVSCAFLPPGGELTVADFLVTDFTFPKYMWEGEDGPLWGDFRITLREVAPHD